MKNLVMFILVSVVSVNVMAVDSATTSTGKSWTQTVIEETHGLKHVYFSSGQNAVALIRYDDSHSQFVEISEYGQRITIVKALTSPFANSDLGVVIKRTQYFVKNADHRKPRTLPVANLTDAAITAGVSTGIGFLAVPVTVVLDVLTSPIQLGYWAGKQTRFLYDNHVVCNSVYAAQSKSVALGDVQYSQVKWALGQARPVTK